MGPGVGFQKSKVYLKGTCNARARAWRPRASRVPRRARSREEVPWATAVSSSSRTAPGFRRLTRGCTVAAPAAAPATPGRTAAPRGPARAVWQFSDNQRRATRQLEGNQRKRSSLIGREVGGWAPVAGPKNPSCRLVLFFGAPPDPSLNPPQLWHHVVLHAPSAASSSLRQAGLGFKNARHQTAKVGAERNAATTTPRPSATRPRASAASRARATTRREDC